MDREVQWSRGKPEEAQMISFLAATAMYFGKLKESEELRKRAVEDVQRFESRRKCVSRVAGVLLLVSCWLESVNKLKIAQRLRWPSFARQFGLPALQ